VAGLADEDTVVVMTIIERHLFDVLAEARTAF
jgi:hypothetical protein